MMVAAVDVSSVTYRYGETPALSGVSFSVASGSLTGLLGPNGSGKTTLFRLLATLLPVQSGTISILGCDVRDRAVRVREQLGVTFQSPALDVRLTVEENLRCHGQLYGMARRELTSRIDSELSRLDLSDRRQDLVETLSGGLKRRVELAKGLLHRPRVLLLDEPSSGLDVAARRRFWDVIDDIRRKDGTTVLVSTHLMDEAERCDELFLLHQGRIVRSGSPEELRGTVAGERLTVRTADTRRVCQEFESLFGGTPAVRGDLVSVRTTDAARHLPDLLKKLGSVVLSVELARPSLDDVFFDATGWNLSDPADPAADA